MCLEPLFMSIKHIVLCFFLIISFGCVAQNIPMKNYTVEDGLPSPEVYDMIQDDYGYLWFSTDHGLSRYDGYEFENFGVKEGLTNNTVFKFYKTKNGNIWCNTFDHSLFYIKGSTPEFVPYKYNEILLKSLTDSPVDNEIYVNDEETVYLSYLNRLGYISI
jgi:ligand-binding sensor domain-containing protein